MKLKIVLIALLLWIGIKLQGQNQGNNIFLPKKFLSFQTMVPVIENEYKETIRQINPKHLNDIVFDKVFKGNVPVYDVNSLENYFPYEFKVLDTLNPQDINAELSAYRADDKPDMNEIKYYNFIEEWIYDPDIFTFEKKVLAYQPVREYFRRDDDEYQKKCFKIIFTILNPENVNPTGTVQLMQVLTLLRLDYPDRDLQDSSFSKGLTELSEYGIYPCSMEILYLNSIVKNKFINSLLYKTLDNQIPVFDPQDGHYIPLSEVEKKAGISMYVMIEDNTESSETVKKMIKKNFNPLEIKSMYFVENWFINPESLNFRKTVEAVIPVRHYIKEPEDTVNFSEPIGKIWFDYENKDRLELIYNQLIKDANIRDCLNGLALFTNMINNSTNQSFKALCRNKQQQMIRFIQKQPMDNAEYIDYILHSMKISHSNDIGPYLNISHEKLDSIGNRFYSMSDSTLKIDEKKSFLKHSKSCYDKLMNSYPSEENKKKAANAFFNIEISYLKMKDFKKALETAPLIQKADANNERGISGLILAYLYNNQYAKAEQLVLQYKDKLSIQFGTYKAMFQTDLESLNNIVPNEYCLTILSFLEQSK